MPGPSRLPINLEKKFDQMNVHDFSSSDDSTETTHSGRYIVQHPEHYAVYYPPGPQSNQPQPSYCASSHPSSSMPQYPYVHQGCYAAQVSQGRMGDGQELHYPPSHIYCTAGQNYDTNPFNLDLSKLKRRPPSYCPSCSLGQQPNVSPPQGQWPNQVECSPETFSNVDYNVPGSYNAQHNNYYPSKLSTNGDISPGIFSSTRPPVLNPNSKFPVRDANELREISLDGSIHSVHQSQPNAFCFKSFYSFGTSDLDTSDEFLSTQPPLSMNPVKESLLDKLKEGKSYTQIFPEARRTPTEGSSEN